jgi:hypothetical protein
MLNSSTPKTIFMKTFIKTDAVGRTFAILMTVFFLAQASAQTWDLKNDWSDTNNPNGVWEYTDGGGNVLTSSFNSPNNDFAPPQQMWGSLVFSGAGGPNIFRSVSTAGGWQAGDIITYVSGFAYGFDSSSSAVSWTSPTNGFVNITGDAWYAFGTSGVDWREDDWWLSTNGTVITQSGQRFGDTTSFNRATPFLFYQGTGGPSVLQNIPVHVGDVITLNITMDPTSWQGYSGGAAGLDFTITMVPPLAISTPLVSQIVNVGSTTSFSVGTSGGSGAVTYQWTFNGTNIVGATNSTLTLTNVCLERAGTYQVSAVSATSAASSYATLTVTDMKRYIGLTISGIVGRNYEIRYKTNLIDSDYITLTNLTLPSSPFIVFDVESANSPARFYQFVLEP